MTVAEIHDKISKEGINLSERMEDPLNSGIFSCFRYLTSEKGLIPFLNTSESFQGYATALPVKLARAHHSFWLWVKLHVYIPCKLDITFSLETKSKYLYLVFVEAKYLSGLSSKDNEGGSPNDQLARELDNLDTVSLSNLRWSPENSITSCRLFFVTQDMGVACTLIAQSLAEYQCNRRSDIYWTARLVLSLN